MLGSGVEGAVDGAMHVQPRDARRRSLPHWTAMKRASCGDTLRLSPRSELKGGPASMLHVGLDLSRRKVDVCLLSEDGEHLDQLAFRPTQTR
jgi:hypothetical protein